MKTLNMKEFPVVLFSLHWKETYSGEMWGCLLPKRNAKYLSPHYY